MMRRAIIHRMTALPIMFLMLLSLPNTGMAAEISSLVPGGRAVGIELKTDGVIISKTADVETDSGCFSPAEKAGLMSGDVIVKLNGKEIRSGDDFKEAITDIDSEEMIITVERGNRTHDFTVTPALSSSGKYEIGLVLRDGMAGIGTVTFYDPSTGIFGALGHPVNDIDSGTLLPVREGTITSAVITDVVCGTAGDPGELVGGYFGTETIGVVLSNGESGIFGKMDPVDTETGEMLQCGEAVPGKAVIYSNVSGDDVDEYEIEITRVFSGNGFAGRNMMIKVTDPDLISKTGGIVQGMSGSPIIQNGVLVGAVTHVLVDDPQKGYGICISNMISEAEKILENAA